MLILLFVLKQCRVHVSLEASLTPGHHNALAWPGFVFGGWTYHDCIYIHVCAMLVLCLHYNSYGDAVNYFSRLDFTTCHSFIMCFASTSSQRH